MVDGRISVSEFAEELRAFSEYSTSLTDTWQLILADHSSYLVKKQLLNIDQDVSNGAYHIGDVDSIHDEAEEEVEDKEAESNTFHIKSQIRLITCEYHVVYSESYAVPVLYFNMYHDSGRLLTLDEVWSLVPQVYSDRLGQERWTFLTQQEHPILGRPYFQLHPCHTAGLMKQNTHSASVETTDEEEGVADASHEGGLKRKGNYLIRWLSTVGPVVRLDIPLQYGLIEND